MFYFKKKVPYTNYNNGIFLHRFAKKIFIKEIFWALDKIIYFIYKIIFFSLNLTEIKKFEFCFFKDNFSEFR